MFSVETDPARRLIGGFSMGAGLAIQQALTAKTYQPSGFITVGTYLPDMEILCPLLEESRIKPRGYLVVGDLDDPCFEISQRIARLFQESKQPCLLEVHAGLVHDYPVDFAQSLSRALEFIHGA
jgi:predicted esterase